MVIGAACNCKRHHCTSVTPPWRATSELRRARRSLDELQRLADKLTAAGVELEKREAVLEQREADLDKRETALSLCDTALKERDRCRALSRSMRAGVRTTIEVTALFACDLSLFYPERRILV